jgi:carbonic anhydrase
MVTVITFLIVLGLGGCAWAAHQERSVLPEESLSRLKEGNARYVAGRGERPRADAARRRETAQEGQHPFAAVLSCSDSRAPVEILFDQGIGDLFVVRVPGNVCNADEIAGIEYGMDHLHTPLCVVLGHTHCGAVTSVVTGAPLHGNVAHLVGNIRYAAVQARKETPSAPEEVLIEAAVRANILQSIGDLLRGSPMIRERVDQGMAKVIGAVYDIASGAVQWLD